MKKTQFHRNTQTTQAATQEKDQRRTDAKKSVDDGLQALLEELKAGKTERFQQWLNFAAQFHQYSAANQWLIEDQARQKGFIPSRVASYNKWQEMGYQVREGKGQALYIWKPKPYKKEVKNKETGETEEKEYTHFDLFPVFDATSILQGEDYKPLPTLFTPLPDSEHARRLYNVLREIATGEGFTCQERALSSSVYGYNAEKLIVVKEGRDALSTLNTFIHEYTHGLLHWDGVQRLPQEVELEAESVAYIVASHFGLHNPFSSDYLILKGNTVESLKADMERIRAAAHTIIVKIEKALGTDASAEEEERAAA